MSKKDSKGRVLKQGEDQLSNGRYRYRYTDKYGERQAIYSWKLTSTDKTPVGKVEDLSLREKIKKLQKDADDGIKTSESRITVSKMIEKYLSTKVNLAISTKENYKYLTNKDIETNTFGKLKVCDVKKSDVKQFYSYLYETKKYAIGTIQLFQNLIYPAFQMMVDDDLIRKNPCKGCMKDFNNKSQYNSKTPLTKEEQEELLRYVKQDKIYSRYYVLIAFMLSTGCRIGETIGITWDDINLIEKYVKIDHQLIYKKQNGKFKFFIDKPKNGEERIIPLQNEIVTILKRYKQETFFVCKSCNYEVDGYKQFVFFNNNMKPHQPSVIVKAFHTLRDIHNQEKDDNEIELPDFTPHTLRHTYCTRMAENGIDIKVLQEVMGHKTLAVTMEVYNHITNDRCQKEIQRVNSVLNVI